MSGVNFPKPRTLVALNVGLVAVYWIASPVLLAALPGAVAVLAQCVRAAVSLMVVIVYGVSLWHFLRERSGAGIHGLTLGIFLAFAADLFGGVYGLVWRWYGQPAEWANGAAWLFPSFLTVIAAIHHIAAPGVLDGRVPRRNIILIGIAFGLSGVVAGVVIGLQIAPSLGVDR
jgi:hypothetical protein